MKPHLVPLQPVMLKRETDIGSIERTMRNLSWVMDLLYLLFLVGICWKSDPSFMDFSLFGGLSLISIIAIAYHFIGMDLCQRVRKLEAIVAETEGGSGESSCSGDATAHSENPA